MLGSRRSRGLRYSRFCRSFRYRVNDYRGDLRRLIDEINAAVIEHDIDLIACGEHFMMRAFVEMAPMLIARCFPMPSIKEFNLLNDKNQFTELCNELGVRCPRSQFVANISELRALLRAGKITPPFVTKPVDFDGATGFLAFRRGKDLKKLNAIEYAPILAQEYVDGADICASVYCADGEIVAFVAYRCRRGTFFTFEAPAIRADCAKIVSATKANGVLNFDMRLTPDGAVYWLECNPRFFMNIDMSLLAGVPFVEFGLQRPRVSGATALATNTNVRSFRATAAEALRLWRRLTPRDFAYLRYVLADPIPWAREVLGWENGVPLQG